MCIPVSSRDASVCPPRNAREQIKSTEIIATTSKQAQIPKIRIRLEWFPFFETLSGVEVEEWYAGASTGSGAKTGAVFQKQAP